LPAGRLHEHPGGAPRPLAHLPDFAVENTHDLGLSTRLRSSRPPPWGSGGREAVAAAEGLTLGLR
jgi:hypothetical protein